MHIVTHTKLMCINIYILHVFSILFYIVIGTLLIHTYIYLHIYENFMCIFLGAQGTGER